MKRRDVLGLFCKASIIAIPFSAKVTRAFTRGLSMQNEETLVLIHDSKDRHAPDYRNLLDAASPFLSAQNLDWRKSLVVWDIQFNEDEIRRFTNKHGRNTNTFKWPVLVSVPESNGLEGEVEIWTTDWLRAREDRYIDACYPISGGWWSVEGDWNPSITKVRNHCFQSPNHAGGKFRKAWLDLLKFEELQSLHSDHHREMIKQGKVYWKNVNAECPAN